MTNKVTLPREVAESLRKAIVGLGEDEVVERHCAIQKNRLLWTGNYSELNNVSMSDLSRAVYCGYTVEQTSEEKVRDYISALSKNYDLAEVNGGGPKSEYLNGQIAGATTVLHLLGIKIEGVNA